MTSITSLRTVRNDVLGIQALLKTPPLIALAAQHALEKQAGSIAGDGWNVCWRGKAQCEGVTLAVLPHHFALLDRLLNASSLAAAVKKGQSDLTFVVQPLAHNLGADTDVADRLEVVVGRCSADFTGVQGAGQPGRLAVRAKLGSLQSRGLGGDVSWCAEAGASDAIVVDFTSAKGACGSMGSGEGARGHDGELSEWATGLVKRLWRMAHEDSRLKVTLGGGGLYCSAAAAMPLLHAILHSRLKAGMRVGATLAPNVSCSAQEAKEQQHTGLVAPADSGLAASQPTPQVPSPSPQQGLSAGLVKTAGVTLGPGGVSMKGATVPEKDHAAGSACVDAETGTSENAKAAQVMRDVQAENVIRQLHAQNEWLLERLRLLEKRGAERDRDRGTRADDDPSAQQSILPLYHPHDHPEHRTCGHVPCMLVEASGVRHVMRKMRRALAVGAGSKRNTSIFRPDMRRPWHMVLLLFAYACALHVFIAFLLHHMAATSSAGAAGLL